MRSSGRKDKKSVVMGGGSEEEEVEGEVSKPGLFRRLIEGTNLVTHQQSSSWPLQVLNRSLEEGSRDPHSWETRRGGG